MWGSCLAETGQIKLHEQLFRFPKQVAEEVLLHELCHLIEPKHNTAFWQLLTSQCADWPYWEGLLRGHTHSASKSRNLV